jgi:UDP-N-acetylmuramyl pentapeptide synthase
MFLMYDDLKEIFPESRGIRDIELSIQTVSISAEQTQPKGLFIPFGSSSGELKTAITNGAVAAVWKKGIELPEYTPNHFPVFFGEDVTHSIKEILLSYREKLNEATLTKKDKTNFLFLDKKLLNDFYDTYDNAVMDAILKEMLDKI